MARNESGLRIREWAELSDLTQTPEAQGLTRSEGWPQAFSVDRFPALQTHNGIWNEITAFAKDVEAHGILEWNASVEPGYQHPSIVFGSDRLLYRSVQAGGETQDPTTDTNQTHWRPLLPAEVLEFATAAQIEAGSSATLIVTPQRFLQALFKASPNARWRATTGQFGLVKRATVSEISGRSGDGYIRARDLPAYPSLDVPNASTTRRGVIEVATVTEAQEGTDAQRAVTPAGVLAALRNGEVFRATTSRRGVVELATPTEAQAASDARRAVTPAGLAHLAPLASPALTGSPTAPTQGRQDNSTKIATTAYVDRPRAFSTLPYQVNFTWNLSQNPNILVEMTGPMNLSISGGLDGGVYTALLQQDATGGRLLTFVTNLKWFANTADQAAQAANAETMMTIRRVNGVIYVAPLWKST